MRSHHLLAFVLSASFIAIETASAQQPAPAPDQPAPPAASTPQPSTVAPAPAAELPAVVVTQPKAAPPMAKPKPVPERKAVTRQEVRAKPAVAQAQAKKPAPAPAPPPAVAAASAPAVPAVAPPAAGVSFAPASAAAADEITATPGATVTDTLQTMPGLAGSTFAPGANRPIVRGLDNNRVRVQESGIGTGDVSDLSEDHAIPVDPCAVTRVDVIHGPAALRFTNKAAGGLVDAETDRVPTSEPAGVISGEVRGGLSSVDDGRDGCFKARAGARGIVVQASGFDRHAGDYDIPGGVQRNSAVDSHGFSIGGSLVWSGGYAGVAYSRITSLYGIPGVESAEERKRIDLGQDRVVAKGEWRIRDFGIEAVRASFGFTDYAHDEVLFDQAIGADAVGSRFLNKEHEGRAEIDHARIATPLGVLRGTAGIQVSSRDLTGLSFEGDSLLEPSTTRKTAGFLLEELHVARPLRLLGALRVQNDDVTGSTYADITAPAAPLAAYDRSFGTLSGSMGLLYDLPLGVTARLTAMHSERAPEAQELFSKGAHEATGTFEIGNPGLGVEKADTIEGGFKRDTGALRFDATAYLTKYRGFIYRDFTGSRCDADIGSCTADPVLKPTREFDEAVFTQRDATFHGVELTGEIDVARLWHGVWGIAGRYDFVRARFDGGENVPRIPPHRLGGGLYYRDGDWRARIDLLHAFRHGETALIETPTSGYTLLNAEASYTMRLGPGGAIAPELTVGLKGENLLDDDVRNSASFKKDEVLAPGRNVRLFGIMRF